MRTLTLPLWSLSLACLLGLSWTEHASAQDYDVNTTIDFERDCGTTVIPDSAFDDPGSILDPTNRLDVASNRFAACGIEAVTSPSDGGAGFTSPQLYRESIGALNDPIAGAGTGTVLVGSSSFTALRDLQITFITPVNELGFKVLDIDNPTGLTITLTPATGADQNATFTVSSGQVDFFSTFTAGIKKVTFSYTEGTLPDDWAVDDLRFNTWKCRDGEEELGAGEECDDDNNVTCDFCTNACKDRTAIGCLDGSTCVDANATKPGSGGCAVCVPPAAVPAPTADVGYQNLDLNTTCADDNLTCTTDRCGGTAGAGNGSGVCEHRINDGFCAVGGACFSDGALNPGNNCQACAASTTKTAFSNLPMNTLCDDGNFCVVNDVCSGTGSCVGQPLDCRETPSDFACTVDTCNEATDQCDHAIAAGCLIDNKCFANRDKNPDNPCQLCDDVKDKDSWSSAAFGTACGEPSCAMGVLTPTPTCDAVGTCKTPEKETCDGAVCADTTSCTGICREDTECLSGKHCEGGRCVDDQDIGEECTRGGECASGFCADGVCCNQACDRSCESCGLAGKVGTCSALPIGEDPENDCENPQVCKAPGVCMPPDRPDGTECTSDDVCKSGHCADGVCCDTACNGACEQCAIAGKYGTCTFITVGTDPEMECSEGAVCNGAGECIAYETRGNGLCAATWGGRTKSAFSSFFFSAVGLLFVLARRRRRTL